MKVRVPKWGKSSDYVTLDTEATKGATFGRDLYKADGTLLTLADFTPAANQNQVGGVSRALWSLVLEIPVNVVALADTVTTGLYAITGAGTSATRALQGTTNRISVAFGDGVSGNPTFDISASYVGQASITTLGTITTGTWNATVISLAKGGTGQDYSTRVANTVWAGPTTGADAAPTFRALVAADIPSLASVYQPLDSDLTAIAALTTTAFGRALLELANAAAARVAIGLGNVDNVAVASMAFSGAQITSGTIDIARLPSGALERLVTVADQAARYALTTASVQNGDSVRQADTGEFWFVVDDTNLGNSSGYQIYTAGTATAVPWSGVSSKPQIIIDIAALTGSNDDVLQKKAGAWTNRTMAQLTADLAFGTGAGTACQGNDARLSDARTPVGTVLTSAYVWIGSGANVAAAVLVSGDVTFTNAGVATLKSHFKPFGRILANHLNWASP